MRHRPVLHQGSQLTHLVSGLATLILSWYYFKAWLGIKSMASKVKKKNPASSYREKLMSVGYTNSAVTNWTIKSAVAGAGGFTSRMP